MGGLDPRTRQWLLEMLASLHEAGKTLVVATHDLVELDRLVDRAVILGEDHRAAAIGAVDALLVNRELLLNVNLIHEHTHVHGDVVHSHPHGHPPGYEHGPEHDDGRLHEHVHAGDQREHTQSPGS
jgi:cobalt/nickel transport system ATP-binding protein